jgi:hypothetical protein
MRVGPARFRSFPSTRSTSPDDRHHGRADRCVGECVGSAEDTGVASINISRDIAAIARAVAGALRLTATPIRRRIPLRTALTGSADVGGAADESRCAYVIAAQRRLIVDAFKPVSARCARYAATVPTSAGMVASRRGAHHCSKSCQSERYARRVDSLLASRA